MADGKGGTVLEAIGAADDLGNGLSYEQARDQAIAVQRESYCRFKTE